MIIKTMILDYVVHIHSGEKKLFLKEVLEMLKRLYQIRPCFQQLFVLRHLCNGSLLYVDSGFGMGRVELKSALIVGR